MSKLFPLLQEVDHGYDFRVKGYQGVIVDAYNYACYEKELNLFAKIAFSEIKEFVHEIGTLSFDPTNSRNVNWRQSGTRWFSQALWASKGELRLPTREWFNVVLLPNHKACVQFAEVIEPYLTIQLLKSEKRVSVAHEWKTNILAQTVTRFNV